MRSLKVTGIFAAAVGLLLGVTLAPGAASAAPRRINLTQVEHGNYRSLLGKWVEAASGTNAFGYGGLRRGGTDKLATSRSRIVNAPMVMRGHRFSDGQGLKNARLVFHKKHGYLVADLANPNVAINYEISFFPRGVPIRLAASGNGIKIPVSKNRIEIWTSNNSYTEVFIQK